MRTYMDEEICVFTQAEFTDEEWFSCVRGIRPFLSREEFSPISVTWVNPGEANRAIAVWLQPTESELWH
jgi:hypothetical protein